MTHYKKRTREILMYRLVAIVLVLLVGLMIGCMMMYRKTMQELPKLETGEFIDLTGEPEPEDFQTRLEAFAREQHLDLSAWPESVLELPELNPETEDYVLHYPLLVGTHPKTDLSDLCSTGSVPLLMQWDERWGYGSYAGEPFGVSGCGPTCLSMVCLYLRGDASLTPDYIGRFSEENGYSVHGSGSSWTLISQGGVQLGLDVTEIPLDEQRMIRNLEVGNPIICAMGPGVFTTTGHFIVLTGYENGKFTVNDPNSRSRSQQLWEYHSFAGDIGNLWVCR